MESNKLKYEELAKLKKLSVFLQPWWLNAVCGTQLLWDVVFFEKNGEILAVWPYVYTQKSKEIVMPMLTQKLGVVFFYPEEINHYKRLSFEKQAITEMLTKLPAFKSMSQNFDHSFTNWQPFYWNGFSQTTRYTYIIKHDQTKDASTFFEAKTKSLIKKAIKLVQVFEADDITELYRINGLTFERKGVKTPYSIADLRRIDESCKQNKSRKILLAKDENNNIHAAVYLVFDQETMYYLIGGIHPDFKSSGAASLLISEGISLAHQLGCHFDFEGSMVESIEAFFRSFGAIQTPYFNINKINDKFYNMKQLSKQLIREVIR